MSGSVNSLANSDPARNFAPSPGTITEWRAPGGPGVRLDTHAYAGYRIPPNYDSMIGKLIGQNEEVLAVHARMALGHDIGIAPDPAA